MYAVIRTGGKQYRVTAGDILEVEKLDGDIGDTLTLEDVLMVSSDDDVLVGQPLVADASVTAKITGQYRGKKIMVFRYRPKKRIRVRKGHRQYLTRLEIESITANGETFTRPEPPAPEPTPEPEEEPMETAVADEAVDETSADETTVVVEGPVAMVETGDGEAELPPITAESNVDESNAEDAGAEEVSDGSDSETVDSDSEQSDSDKEDKE